MVDGVSKSAEFKRTESLSIDYIEEKVDTSSIRWINDCEFILTKLNPKTYSEKKPIHFKILTTTDTSYVFEYKLAVKNLNAQNKIRKGTAIKIDNL